MKFPRQPILDHPLTLGSLAAAAGAGIGLARADWQWAVEVAQVSSGIVRYDRTQVPAQVAAALWSVVEQVTALGLLAGLSEVVLSQLLSAAETSLAVLMLALITYACSRRTLVALPAALVMIATYDGTAGTVYPIFLLPTAHTFGQFALGASLLAIGAIGAGWTRTGAALLGLLPAVHASLGLAIVAAAAAALSWHRALERGAPPVPWRWVAAGGMGTALSYAVHRLTWPRLPPPDDADRYLRAFAAFWDGHRQPVDLSSTAVYLNVIVVIVALVWLRYHPRRVEAQVRLMLRWLGVIAAGSLVAALLLQVPMERLPGWFIAAMPGRLLNIGALAAYALLAGLTASALLPGGPAESVAPPRRPRYRLAPIAIAVFLLTGIASYAIALRARPLVPGDVFESSRGNLVLQVAAAGRGTLLVSGDLWLAQLRTRRPILIDGGSLDTLPYTLSAAPVVDRILRDVYEIDLFAPPADARHGGRIPNASNRRVWESYSRDRWRRIGQDWQVSQVLAFGDWEIDLPAVARASGMALYAIPEPGR